MSKSRQYVELLLTCEDVAEATRIADALLQQRLIASVWSGDNLKDPDGSK